MDSLCCFLAAGSNIVRGFLTEEVFFFLAKMDCGGDVAVDCDMGGEKAWGLWARVALYFFLCKIQIFKPWI